MTMDIFLYTVLSKYCCIDTLIFFIYSAQFYISDRTHSKQSTQYGNTLVVVQVHSDVFTQKYIMRQHHKDGVSNSELCTNHLMKAPNSTYL